MTGAIRSSLLALPPIERAAPLSPKNPQAQSMETSPVILSRNHIGHMGSSSTLNKSTKPILPKTNFSKLDKYNTLGKSNQSSQKKLFTSSAIHKKKQSSSELGLSNNLPPIMQNSIGNGNQPESMQNR